MPLFPLLTYYLAIAHVIYSDINSPIEWIFKILYQYKLLLTVSKGLNLLREAEQYLAQAQWVVLQTPNCDPAIKSKLYRDLGLLFIAQGNTIDAKKHFAEDVSNGASL